MPRALLSGESRCRARSRDTRRPRGWVVVLLSPSFEGLGGGKSIVSSETSSLPCLQSTGNPARTLGELSVGRKGRVGRSRDRATSGKGRKGAKVAAVLSRRAPEGCDKVITRREEGVSAEIFFFWMGYMYIYCYIYFCGSEDNSKLNT